MRSGSLRRDNMGFTLAQGFDLRPLLYSTGTM
jgi:hypothetical protein